MAGAESGSPGADPTDEVASLAEALSGGPRRVVVDEIRPSVDGGRYPIKRTVGDRVIVEVDLLADGHDILAGVLMFRRRGAPRWQETPLDGSRPGPGTKPSTKPGAAASAIDKPPDDVWRASFVVNAIGPWEYTASGWIDRWGTWAWKVRRKMAAGQEVELDLRAGAALAAAAGDRASGEGRQSLQRLARLLVEPGDPGARAATALDAHSTALMLTHADRTLATTFGPPLAVTVDPARARFSSWYEMFPRSCAPPSPVGDGAPLARAHGTFKDAERELPRIADMGFDIVYLPPIHPIGLTHRKGPNNTLVATATDPGSPWAIGAAEGGHKAIHPQLGTAEDFRHFVQAARAAGLEVAMDIAFQASPDHPYVTEHPEWFVHRPDGSIQYAENPPKSYEDIYPFDFTGAAWATLWLELRSVFLHWIGEGIRVFRVDNPHTKPIPFWEWCIRTIKDRHPEVIFLAEAFTRPKLMHVLAKVGFSQSYTYFTWRTTKTELTTYLRSLVDTEVKEFFRPNFWPNTPDILPEHLQVGTRATFIARAVLASTLSPSWGIYGPVYELGERVAREGSEEYAGSEKYQLRDWDRRRPDSLSPLLRRLNQIRRDNTALQRLTGTVFHGTDNDLLLCYSRSDELTDNCLLVVVNLDAHNRQSGWVSLDLRALGLVDADRFQVHDLISDARFLWQGASAFISLDPGVMPAHIFRLRRRVHTEQSFEYYL